MHNSYTHRKFTHAGYEQILDILTRSGQHIYIHPLVMTRTEIEEYQRQGFINRASLASVGDAGDASSVVDSVEDRKSAPLPPPLPSNYSRVFHSFQLHEIQEYYPMRAVHAVAGPSTRYHLIYNIAYYLPYPIASDLWSAPAMQDLITRAKTGQDTKWYRNISMYLHAPRPQFELYDLAVDPTETHNVAGEPAYATILTRLQADIKAFQYATNDDWTIKYTHE